MPALVTSTPHVPSKKAVLVGIGYETNDDLKEYEFEELPGSREDVRNLRKVLISMSSFSVRYGGC